MTDRDDFVISKISEGNALGGSRYTKVELESNLAGYKDAFGKGIESSLNDELIFSTNSEARLRGLRQGHNQCFVTSFVAWLVIQGRVDVAKAGQLLGKINRELTDNVMAGAVAGGSVGGRPLNEIMRSLSEKNAGQKIQVEFGDASTEYNQLSVFNKGKEIGSALAMGAGLIIQDGFHFRLVFVDKSGDVYIFDPLKGIPEKSNINAVMSKWSSVDITKSTPSFVLIKTV